MWKDFVKDISLKVVKFNFECVFFEYKFFVFDIKLLF